VEECCRFRQKGDASGSGRLLEGRVAESASRFYFCSGSRVSGSVRGVQAQVVAGLLEPGLQSDVSERLARSGSCGSDANLGPSGE
jgi:hypothetical protein